jgi:uncharacterized membrane protein YedE/YeeE
MFPLGTIQYVLGGVLTGAGVGLVFVTTGLHATQSSFFDSTLSFLLKNRYFRQKEYVDSRDWRVVLAIGMITGALLCTVLMGQGSYVTSVQLWRLALGGLLVGVGTRLSQGCTSGHGISGLASLSTTSLYAVLTFLCVGILTAMTMQTIGIRP